MSAKQCPVCGRVVKDPTARFCDLDGATLVSAPPQAPARRPQPPAAPSGSRTYAATTTLLTVAGVGMMAGAAWLLMAPGPERSSAEVSVDVALEELPWPQAKDVPELLKRCYGATPPTVPTPAPSGPGDVFERTKEAVRIGTTLGAGTRPITLEEEREYGDALHTSILKESPRSTDRRATDRLERLAARLIPLAPRRSELPYRFTLLGDAQVNAMMGPGGEGFFYTGLLDGMPRDENLTFVIGHELAHSELGHATQHLSLVLAGRDLGRATLGRDMDGASITLSRIGAGMLTSSYDQDLEFEADRLGLCLAYLSGAGADAGVGAMDALGRQGDRDDAPSQGAERVAYDILTSHPPLPDRRAYQLRLSEQIHREGRR